MQKLNNTSTKDNNENEEKKQIFLNTINNVNDVDLQHNLLDKFFPFGHFTVKLISGIVNICVCVLLIAVIVHLILNYFVYNNYQYVSGDFFMAVALGIIISIIKTRNLVRQYRIFTAFLILLLVFYIFNIKGFQNIMYNKVSETDMNNLIQNISKKI